MAASPKSIFLGIVAFGLPLALTTGWTLGAPRSGMPDRDGAGGFGRAPISAVSPIPTRPAWAPAPLTRPSSAAPAAASSAAVRVSSPSTRTATSPSVSASPTPGQTVVPEASVLPGPTALPSIGEPEATTRPTPDRSLVPDVDGPGPVPAD